MPEKNKCFSNCRLFERPECNPPRCKYVNGDRLKYCRLSHRYKMKKPSCNVTRKVKKKDIHTNATKTIGRFIKQSKKHLQFICSDSGVCIAFGRNSDEITRFFKGFTDFTYAVSPIKQIGKMSANGFVKEIAYKKEGYKADAILKSSKTEYSDNLVYEYLVGIKYINRIMKRFPCFLETYGLYYYANPAEWKRMSSSAPVRASHLTKLQIQNTIDYSKACNESNYASILIQHIKEAKPLSDYSGVTTYNKFIKYDLIYVLFIIYQALSSISKNFTHYDLHDSNVLLYEPEKGKYIEYRYHHEDGTETVFNSPYIPKIIDYGRSFFDNGNLNSRKIYDRVCKEKDCDPDCGENVGFTWLNTTAYLTISSSQKNESHDLRLLSITSKYMEELFNVYHVKPTEATFVEIDSILNKVVYGVSLSKTNELYGTEENLKINSSKIYNVNGAFLALKEAIRKPAIIAENQKNYSKISSLIGSLHVYEDGRSVHYEPFL